MKKCSICKENKINSCYWKKITRHGKSVLMTYCKPCSTAKKKQWMKDNPELVKGQQERRAARLKNNQKEQDIRLKRSQKKRDDLADSYMIDLLTFGNSLERKDITSEMIKNHRLNIKLKRTLGLTRFHSKDKRRKK